jgi:hypothetical protein
MDQTSKLYRCYAELTILKNDLQEFEARHPDPNEWTHQQVAHHDSLTKRHTNLRAEIAELGVRRRRGPAA